MTATKEELLALAERVEGLDGPDREVDAAIAIELFDGGADHLDDPRDVTRARKVVISHGARAGNFEVVGFSGVSLRRAPCYTASLDAAVLLVAKGMSWSVNDPANADGSRSIFGYASRCYAYVEGGPNSHNYAATPALALTAAALRAQAELVV